VELQHEGAEAAIALTRPEARRLFGPGWSDEAKRVVAQPRSTHDLWATISRSANFCNGSARGCPEFSGWWKAHDIRGTATCEKRLHHPKLGVLLFEHASFQSNDDPSLRLIVYTPI
jgi:hypothetical protein